MCVVFVACKKKTSDEPAPTPIENQNPTNQNPITYGLVQIHLHTWVGTEYTHSLESADEEIATGFERKISLGTGRFFLSDFELVNMDGSIYSLADTVIMWDYPKSDYEIGMAPIGKYKSIRFKVGFDSETIKKPLETVFNGVLNKPAMWFESAANADKYVFAHLKGKIDTAAIPDESNTRVGYEFKIGTKSRLTQITLSDLKPGSEFNLPMTFDVFHLYVNMERLFDGVNLQDINSLNLKTIEANSATAAEKITGNISRMFNYE